MNKVRSRMEREAMEREIDTTRIIRDETEGLQPRADQRQSRSKTLEEKNTTKKRQPVIRDAVMPEMHEIRAEELHKHYFKESENLFKKYLINEDFKRLYREVI